MRDLMEWFTGGKYYDYHILMHCMDGDILTLTIVVMACIGVFTGYWIIAWRWSQAARSTPETDAKHALNELKWIFTFCGMCGYFWVVMETFWPAWRLYIFFLFALNVFTWRYVFRVQGLEEIYRFIKEKDALIYLLDQQQKEITKLKKELETKETHAIR